MAKSKRRRKKKNPLLTRILVISIVAHAIALPIAAHYGAFDKVRKEFGASRVVMVTVPPDAEEKKKTAEKPKKAPKTQTEHKAGSTAPKASNANQKSNLPQPKVVASSSGGGDEGGGPSVDPNGTGTAGALPKGPGTGGAEVPKSDAVTHPAEPTRPTPPPVSPPETKAELKPEVKPEPMVEPKPHRIVQAEPSFAPEPVIPDDLRTEPFEKTLVVEADVDTGGHPTNVRVAETTGVKELDEIGLDTAKKYRFKPATFDEAPVDQHVRFRIIFKVE